MEMRVKAQRVESTTKGRGPLGVRVFMQTGIDDLSSRPFSGI